MDALKMIAAASMKEEANVPKFEIGDTVKVSVNIREGERERIQMFEGTVIARRGIGVAETFTVRRTPSRSATAEVLSVFNSTIFNGIARHIFCQILFCHQAI